MIMMTRLSLSGPFLLLSLTMLNAPVVLAQTKTVSAAEAQTFVERAAAAAFAKFPSLKTNELAITFDFFNQSQGIVHGRFRGDARIYPASVIKLFYLEAAHRWMEEGKIVDTPELRRALKDMIVESYNEATHYVVDVLTGTTSGPELPPQEMAVWMEKRNAVNRYFAGRGFRDINANQKPWCEGPYGRERAFVGETYTNRNALTTDATARLLTEIARGEAVTPARSQQMLELLKRDPFSASNEDGQSKGFTGKGLPPGSLL